MTKRRSLSTTQRARIGLRLGKLTAVEIVGQLPNGSQMVPAWRFRCDCGNDRIVRQTEIFRIRDHSCGCTNPVAKRALAGRRFGAWSVLREGARRAKRVLWVCRCDCGTEREVSAGHLISGASLSCGCTRSSSNLRHGYSRNDPRGEYRIWMQMIGRCENQNLKSYANYGGRGIKVCQRWRHDFPAFLEDMGPRPSSNHSIDRIDNAGDYEPGNCRWATRSEQMRNTRRNRIVTVRGEQMPLAVAVERFGCHYGTVKWRLYQGQSAERALGLE